MVDPVDSEAQLQEAVAHADRARRIRDTAGRLWAIAPFTAAASLLIAVAGRLRGWTPLVTLLILAAAAAALAAYALTARRRHDVSDADISHIDADAGLHGELRSAHWFAAAPERDDWIRFHLARAAERVHAVDWASLYPAPAAGRAKLATGALALAAIVLAIVIPGRAGVAASDGARNRAAATRRPAILVALPPELRKQLEDMLTTAESGQARALTVAEVRALLAKLDELAHRDPSKQGAPAAATAGQPPPANEADIKAFAERAKKAAESKSIEPDVRDALSDVADKLNQGDRNANAMSKRESDDAASGEKEAASGEAQQSKSGSGQQGGAVQSMKEASGGSGVGVVMMTDQDASSSRDGGMGLGGGSADRNGGGRLADIGAALRRETIEASVDNQGDNVLTQERRKTEHADATTAYSRSAPQAAERGGSTAPPPVPESRRAAVKSYFIRKQ